MNDQKIYALIAKTPNIRAVQICDALDEELVDVSAALRSLVAVGDVVRHSGPGPNGHPAQMYNLSETFKKSREGVALLASEQAAQPTAVPQPDPVTEPAKSQPDALGVPVFSQQDKLAPVRSKVDMAIDHLNVHKRATDAELRTIMSLPKTSAPIAYLKAAMKAGKVARDRDGWTLGPGKPDANPEAETASLLPKPQTEVPAPAPAAVERAPAQEVATNERPDEAVFRCGLWSDGVLELQRNGSQVALLNQREGEQLVDFVGRMLGQAEKVTA